MKSRFDALVPRLLKRDRVPGASIGVIRAGEPAWRGNYGVADVRSSRRVDEKTLFNLGSVTKAITAWGVMALVEDGVVQLDDPVVRYLKRWRPPESQFRVDMLTVRRLLSHTSGLSAYPASESFNAYLPGEAMPPLEDALSRSYGTFGKLRLVCEPGSSYQYNNGNYAVLQLMIEDVSGIGFAQFMQRRILDPLGMRQSAYYPAEELVATPYDENMTALPRYRFVEQASGGLYSTADDTARFVAAAMRGPSGLLPGRSILSPATAEAMLSPAQESRGSHGLGYKIFRLSETVRMVGHDGANPGWRATFMTMPERGAGIVVLTNSDVGGHIVADIVCAWADWEKELDLPGLCDGTRPIPAR